MKLPRLVGLVLVVLGIVVLVIGINKTDSFGDQFSKFFTGNYTDKAIWHIVGGALLIVAGGALSGGLLAGCGSCRK